VKDFRRISAQRSRRRATPYYRGDAGRSNAVSARQLRAQTWIRAEGGVMRIVYRAENIIDAHLVRHVLEQHGILAHVSGEYLIGALGDLPMQGLVNVLVAEHDVEEASRLAAAVDAELSLPPEPAAMDDGFLPDPA
jgi:hypothetical protein